MWQSFSAKYKTFVYKSIYNCTRKGNTKNKDSLIRSGHIYGLMTHYLSLVKSMF